MCGIFSTLCDERIENLKIYFNKIKHRGPDDSGIRYLDIINNKPLIFGFHRLSIIDLDEKSMQPLGYDNLYLICNGEIFNYKNLQEKYNLYSKTGSDCEVIIHLYNLFGRNKYALQKTLQEIDGEFSFVLYDKKNKTLIAARDPFGIRPLFYSCSGMEICFASELKALGFRKNVKAFKPGSYIYREHHGKYFNIEFDTYYNLSIILIKNTIYTDLSFIKYKINELLKKSVKLRLMSDRPLGCFLSGGVDSSIVTALVAKHNPNIECFTIGLDNSVDIKAAIKVITHLNNNGANIKHHIVNFTIEEGIQSIKDVIKHLETYDITTIRASTPQYLLSKYISQNTNIKVILSGEGSDEVNASYLYNRLAPSSSELHKDSLRLVNELYMFDNLRVDRTTAAFGLEVRVPFLCKHYVEFMFCVDSSLKMCNYQIEKKLLRDSFAEENLLPHDILYRTKEAFSDAVSSNEISWYKSLCSYIDTIITDKQFLQEQKKYINNIPPTKEALFYRQIFEELYPGRENILTHYWMPSWIDTKGDPSATVLDCYTKLDTISV